MLFGWKRSEIEWQPDECSEASMSRHRIAAIGRFTICLQWSVCEAQRPIFQNVKCGYFRAEKRTAILGTVEIKCFCCIETKLSRYSAYIVNHHLPKWINTTLKIVNTKAKKHDRIRRARDNSRNAISTQWLFIFVPQAKGELHCFTRLNKMLKFQARKQYSELNWAKPRMLAFDDTTRQELGSRKCACVTID